MSNTIQEKWMRFAINEAIIAFDEGEVPIGSIIVYKNKIIGKGYNQVEKLNDPTAHAEMIAITSAANSLSDWRLNECMIFVTKEPCPMCAGAILNSRIKFIGFGVYDENIGSCGSYYDICRDKSGNDKPVVSGGILEQDCKYLIDMFFSDLRNK
tara:strand:- start:142 stop:603 length:462 start_codon:yes stop_codon:yes gene_type:complete